MYGYISLISHIQHIINPTNIDRSLCFKPILNKVQGKVDPDNDCVCKRCLFNLKWLKKVNSNDA